MRVAKFLFFIILFISYFGNIHGQIIYDEEDFSLFFSDKSKNSGYLQGFQKTNSGDVIYVQNKSNIFNSFSKKQVKYSFGTTDNYRLSKNKPTKLYGNGKKTSLQLFTVLGDKILAFSYGKDSYTNEIDLFYHYLLPEEESQENHGFPITDEFSISYNTIHPNRLMVASKENKKCTSLLYFPETKDTDFSLISYLLFEMDTQEPIFKSLTIPYSSSAYEPVDFIMFNKEKQVLINGIKAPTIKDRATVFSKIEVSIIKQDTVSLLSIQKPSVYFSEITVKKVEEELIIHALYKEEKKRNTAGVMVAKIDKQGEITSLHYVDYPSSIKYNVDNSPRLNLENNYSYETMNNGFKILDVFEIQNKTIGIIEYKGVEFRYSGVGFPGNMSTLDKFYWTNDLITYQINAEGKLDWIYEIPKIQRTVNDGGYFLSSSTYLHQQNLYLFFNDNFSNYDEEGVFAKGEKDLQITQYNVSRNTIAYVKINIENGDFTRKRTIGKKEMQLLFVPSLSLPQEEKNQLFIFAGNNKKYRIGRIFFNK